ncbi:MAG: ABC transporter permease [Gemmatimonadaceae bacterium]
MIRVLRSRLLQATAVVLVVVTTCFALIRLAPGDPFFAALEEPGVPPESAALLREQFGYDRPLTDQYLRFLGGVVRGDLGWSHSRGRPVSAVLREVLPNTALLMASALLLGLVGGVLLGAWQGWRAESRLAAATDRLALVVLSIPEFVVALLLALGPALAWGLFPIGGMRTEFGPRGLAGIVDVLHHLALPAFTLALVLAAIVARHQRAAMRAVRDAEFVRASRARGTRERTIARHALRNALVPVLTLTGVILPSLLGGAVLVERIFAWPGMGRTMVDAVLGRDYPLVAGGVIVSSIGVVVATLIADLAVLWADPRLRTRL